MSTFNVQGWWEIPCKTAIPLFEGLAEERDMAVDFVSMYDLSDRRRQLGWETNLSGRMTCQILSDEGWREAVDRRLEDRSKFHVVNGVYQNERIRYLVSRLVRTGCKFGIIMEAPSNLATGLMRAFRGVVAPIITPLRTMRAARKAAFVMSASGQRQRDFERLGFAPSSIFPFGYFPDFPQLPARGGDNASLRILCIGWLKPYKGQDVLLRAVDVMRRRGIPLRCVITGYGSSEEQLKALQRQLGLEQDVEFAGVVSNERLAELFAWSNVLVAPGFEEPWGIRVNEALLSGLPVIASDGVGASELVSSSGAGELFEAGSADSLVAAFERFRARISTGNDVFEAAQGFRRRIEPRAAGRYLAEVIRFTEATLGSGAARPALERPVPPWFPETT